MGRRPPVRGAESLCYRKRPEGLLQIAFPATKRGTWPTVPSQRWLSCPAILVYMITYLHGPALLPDRRTCHTEHNERGLCEGRLRCMP